MDTLQCAIVLAKLERFDWEVEQRIAIGARYNELLDARGIERVQQRPGRTSVYAQYTVLVEDRRGVQEKLNAGGIPTAVHYPVPLNEQPAYAHCDPAGKTPVSKALSERVMSLPMHPDLSKEDQQRVVDALA
jgi:UDP-2-acetamido-2-deoxy-ribo-hexuluronate aminotransferase